MASSDRDSRLETAQRAEALLVSLVGVAAAEVRLTPAGHIEAVRVATRCPLSNGQVVQNVRSALFAGLGLSVLPAQIELVDAAAWARSAQGEGGDMAMPPLSPTGQDGTAPGPTASPGATSAPARFPESAETSPNAAPRAGMPRLAGAPHTNGLGLVHGGSDHGNGRSNGSAHVNGATNGSAGGNGAGAVDRNTNGNGQGVTDWRLGASGHRIRPAAETTWYQPRNDAAAADVADAAASGPTLVDPCSAGPEGVSNSESAGRAHAPRVAEVQLEQRGDRLRCRVVLAVGAARHAAAAEAAAGDAAEIGLAARVTCDALRAAQLSRARFDGAVLVNVAGRTHVVVAVSDWSAGRPAHRAGAAVVQDSMEYAAAVAVVQSLNVDF